MEEVTGLIAVGTGWVAILMPVFLVWVIFYFANSGISIWYAWIGCFCSFRKTNKDLKRTRDS